ncbi:MAG: DUF402 domain-containing protein [Nitrospirota bacterium]
MPLCLETKHTLSGATEHYSCELIHYESGFGILRYIIDRAYDVHGVKLSPGDETLALYWEDRPYTLYIWKRNLSPVPVYYFNIADQVSLSPREFVWRDLAVDVLVDERGVHVLDEHEVPPGLAPPLLLSIKSATTRLLADHRTIIRDAEALIKNYASTR